MNISVIGCGRWGTFIGWYLDKIGNNVTIYGKPNSTHFIELEKYRKNKFLSIRPEITLTDNLEKTINTCDILIISINSQSLRELMEELAEYDISNKIIVLCMKGIEISTGKRLTEVVNEFTLGDTPPCAIWVGPGHVEDFVSGIPNCMVIDCNKKEISEYLVKNFSSDLIRFYIGTDLIGNEIGAAAKNVIGIAAGMLDGLGVPSLKGALMSRGTREIARLIDALGGNEISTYGLAHLGDYQATLFSEHSHNRQFGENFVKGKEFSELAEGVYTTKAILKLGDKYNIDLPICKAVDDVIYENKNPKETLSNLFIRSIKEEF